MGRIYTLTKFPVAVYPIIVTMVGATAFAAWYVARLATRPDVVWNRKSNPAPYLKIEQNETIKMMDPSNHFAKSWSRKEF